MFAKIKGMLPLNWDLMASPVNWVVIVLMLAIAGAAIAVIIPPKIIEEA